MTELQKIRLGLPCLITEILNLGHVVIIFFALK